MAAIGLAWRDQSLRSQADTVLFRVLTLPGLLERIRRSGRWWVVAPALAAVAGVGLAFLQPPRYTATESILLAEAPSYLPTSVSGVGRRATRPSTPRRPS